MFILTVLIRIEKEIFPEYKDDDLNLLEVTWQEDYVQQLGDLFRCFKLFTHHTALSSFPVSEAKAIFDANTVGPRAYVKMYDKYKDILTGQSLNDKEEFLKSEATLDQFRVSFL